MLSRPYLTPDESGLMNTVWLRLVTVVLFALCGLAAALLIWVAGSHRYGFLSTLSRTTGIEGLVAICAVAYGSSTAVLWSIRRTVSPAAVRVLTFVLAACALAFVFLLFVLALRFFYGLLFVLALRFFYGE